MPPARNLPPGTRVTGTVPTSHQTGPGKAPGTGRKIRNLLAITVLLPLALLALGLWQAQRGADDGRELAQRRDRLAQAVSALQARAAAGRPLMELAFRRGDRLFGGPLAITEARDALDTLQLVVKLSDTRNWLPPVVALAGALATTLSIVVLVTATLLGRAGRGSRDRLVRGFGMVRRVLPALMGAQVLLMATGFVAGVAFEGLAVPEAADLSAGGIELLVFAVMGGGLILWSMGRAVLALRRTVAAFTPDPLAMHGRIILPGEAPGLFAMIDGLSDRLGALRPDQVVVGLTGGFFVSSGLKLLQPGPVRLDGRTLYLPLPYLPLLRSDEVAAIVAHELGHFAGEDTDWSLRFLPIYAGVSRSLEAVGGGRSPLTGPAFRLGLFAIGRFHAAVRHWSRLREFGADATGAGVTSAHASARALLRTTAASPVIDRVLDAAANAPETAPQDLVAAVLDLALARGLDDPAALLDQEQPHPTDSHPPTQQRLLALGRPPTAAMLAEASAAPGTDASSRLAALFAEPARLCRGATADFLAGVRARRKSYRAALARVAASVGTGERALSENTRVAILLLAVAIAASLTALGLLCVPLGDELVIGQRFAAGAVLATVPVLAWRAAILRRRGRQPFLVLRPEAICIAALDGPIAWEHIADLDMLLSRGRLTTRILLPPEAPLPGLRPGARGVRLDRRQRIVTLRARLPPRMSGRGFAELIGEYRRAAEARALLARESGADPPVGELPTAASLPRTIG